MPRSVKEWVGKTPDSKVPASVQARVFDTHGGICHISGRKISAGEEWHLEHVIPLFLGGENRESNMRPALVDKHKTKTAAEMKVKAKTDAVKKKHLGITKPKGKIPSRVVEKKPRPDKLPVPAPRAIYEVVK